LDAGELVRLQRRMEELEGRIEVVACSVHALPGDTRL
jgi:hypothetical protein